MQRESMHILDSDIKGMCNYSTGLGKGGNPINVQQEAV